VSDLRLVDITKLYGDRVAAENVSIAIPEGQFFTILGASGSGKTTCLRIVAGYLKPDRGAVLIGGVDVTKHRPYRRNLGMVFQQYALFPHLTVAQNISFGLKTRRVPSAELKARTLEALRLVQLEDYAGHRPDQLSGGQRQRVALARAVVIRPDVLLLDEPLSALDLKLREQLRAGLKAIQRKLGITTILVTHDQGEALSLSDQVAVMAEGHILQVAAPRMIYDRPANAYVANFVGRSNFIPATVGERSSDGWHHVLNFAGRSGPPITIRGQQSGIFAVGEHCFVFLRPEDAVLGPAHQNRVEAKVTHAEYVGDSWHVSCEDSRGTPLQVKIGPKTSVPDAGSSVIVSWSNDVGCLLKDDSHVG
jgi:ABC-type Fe3+/spermidine/putrescine transport system ATPase subunit